VRTIPGYVSPVNGKDSAIVEKLSCGHEYVDGKFNVDALYFSYPKHPAPGETVNVVPAPREYRPRVVYVRQKSTNVNVMDVLCVISLIFLSFTVPPLVIVPALYFLGRFTGK